MNKRMKLGSESEMVFIEVEKYLVPESVEFYKLVDGKLISNTEMLTNIKKNNFVSHYFSGTKEDEVKVKTTTTKVVNLTQLRPVSHRLFQKEKKIVCKKCSYEFHLSVDKQEEYFEKGWVFPLSCYRCIRERNRTY
jgi:hypothetical protein